MNMGAALSLPLPRSGYFERLRVSHMREIR